MIKLIATDIDGTLVKDSSKEVYKEIPEIIHEIVEKDILFIVASGRQYYSIRNMFHEVADKIMYIAENGAYISYEGKVLGTTIMEPEIVKELIEDLRGFNKECYILVSTPETAYIESKDPSFYDLMANSYCNKVTVIDDFLAQPLEVIKIAIYRKDGIRQIGQDHLIPKWDDRLKVCMAGEKWVDFMDQSVDKGHALQEIQRLFGITKEETMVFGDHSNDVGLLSQAEESYAVENAVDEVKEVAKHICKSYHEKGVYEVLKGQFGM